MFLFRSFHHFVVSSVVNLTVPKKLPRQIQRNVAMRTDRFKSNPFHPSLRTEKLHSKHHRVLSFRVDQAYRYTANPPTG